MTADAFTNIEKLEADLWEAADKLRANSKLTSSDYYKLTGSGKECNQWLHN